MDFREMCPYCKKYTDFFIECNEECDKDVECEHCEKEFTAYIRVKWYISRIRESDK